MCWEGVFSSIFRRCLFDDVCDYYITVTSREKKQQHRLQKTTYTGNAATVESVQEQEVGTRIAKGSKKSLMQEMDLSNSPYTVTGGQHNEVNKSTVNNERDSVAVPEVSRGTARTCDVATTIQVGASMLINGM